MPPATGATTAQARRLLAVVDVSAGQTALPRPLLVSKVRRLTPISGQYASEFASVGGSVAVESGIGSRAPAVACSTGREVFSLPLRTGSGPTEIEVRSGPPLALGALIGVDGLAAPAPDPVASLVGSRGELSSQMGNRIDLLNLSLRGDALHSS
jgi:hypothetical protein